jgi:hypothetical protein
MAVNYSQTDSLEVALQKTFSGKHPCKLCLVVKEGKQDEKKQELVKVETKPDLLCLRRFDYVHLVLPFSLLSVPADVALPRSEAPPLPPPRFA